MSNETYADDLAFLNEYAEIVEIETEDGGRVAIAPGFQGRAMTSCLADGEKSFGWLNRAFIAAGEPDEHFNNYGGEDRFWLGPEGGQFALWFAAGEPFDMAHWRTPAGFGSGAFAVTGREPHSVAMGTAFQVKNYSGTTFDCAVQRRFDAIDREYAAELLGVTPGADVQMVAFESNNALRNAGDGAWRPETGLLSVWTLGQFKPLPRGKVIVPFRAGREEDLGVKATTDYFGAIPPERIEIGADRLLFACDGKWRSKIGISPQRARSVCGSWDPDQRLLTIVQFNLPADAARLPYVNSLWEIQNAPYAGDVINSYNDGSDTPGGSQLGPFYELETSSPAAELNPGESITHIHRTFHFAGRFDALNDLSAKVLGVDLW